ncbi:MAG: Hsp33 family molecular chaperone HslO [Caldiserica bacterium]|nr:Hsp33 family molecular chaperone HslO [Caldisericota bacterium]MDH7562723.1 Hsp33 family molecular chaperone HslO [Caldisericota bacterium]
MDYLVKGLVQNSVSVLTCRTTDLVETARKKHDLSPLSACVLGRLLTLSALMGGLLKENQSINLQVVSDGPARGVYAQCDWLGRVRGYIKETQLDTWLTPEGKLDVPKAIGKGVLYVVKDLGLKDPYVGTVQIVTGGLASDLAYYFLQSEQVPSVVGCGVFVSRDGTVKAAGGYIVQATPGTPEQTLEILEKQIEDLKPPSTLILQGKSPEEIFLAIAGNLPSRITQENALKFHCQCSRYRARRALSLLGREELRDILKTEGKAIVKCQFCNSQYQFSEDDILEILQKLEKTS